MQSPRTLSELVSAVPGERVGEVLEGMTGEEFLKIARMVAEDELLSREVGMCTSGAQMKAALRATQGTRQNDLLYTVDATFNLDNERSRSAAVMNSCINESARRAVREQINPSSTSF